jgi:3-oxoacyl-[acyl-carrier protein] reductase
MKGKVAIVSGAAGSGIGRSIALTLGREGAQVVVNYRTNLTSAEAVVSAIERQGSRAVAIQADVFTAEGCQQLVSAAQAHFGQVDIVIIGPGGGWHPEAINQLNPEAALDDLNQEVAPVYHLLPRVLPGMYDRGWGRIIGIATHLGKLSPSFAYNAAKAARLQALLLAADPAWPHGVTINVIEPGPVNGIESLEEAIEQCAHGPAWENRRNITPQDIAEGVAFICSEAGGYITGCTLPYLFNK